jgi:hypothetical protein
VHAPSTSSTKVISASNATHEKKIFHLTIDSISCGIIRTVAAPQDASIIM